MSSLVPMFTPEGVRTVVDDHNVEECKMKGYTIADPEMASPTPAQVATLKREAMERDKEELSDYKVDELKMLAVDEKVDLEGVTKKDDILSAILKNRHPDVDLEGGGE